MSRPARTHSRRLLSTVSILFLAFLALVCLCPPAVSAEETHPEYGTVIGIDLRYYILLRWRGGRVEIIANDQGHRITPSWVSFTDEERLVGDAAKNAFHSNPTNTVFDAKRLIGRKTDDPELKRDIKHWPFKSLRRTANPLLLSSTRMRTAHLLLRKSPL
ncbi:hypothetical protein D9756_010900 [Leucocoprinus leucothites]|uniref:non-chaperonin molecular chaperone ATPase n=1 Tax=Leucocoprinus leucothites TaxID=201217 RepID=A0A8H5CPU1_9AGAR|nr:hypothetical protein D9756_010900 [Leucoagaricus leucothites]